MVVVDLGAAPGGGSQWVRQALGGVDQANPGRVLVLDILDMSPLAGVEFLHGDFREDEVLSTLEAMLEGAQVDLVLYDMAPNKRSEEHKSELQSLMRIAYAGFILNKKKHY